MILTYQFVPDPKDPPTTLAIHRNLDNACIPLTFQNRDCRQFVIDWKAGELVLNRNGNPRTWTAAREAALHIQPED